MKRGLVIDDSAVIRMVSSRILGLLHFQSAEADTGEKALDYCAKQMPDVILLDSTMPRTDTLELLRSLRRLPGGDAAKIILCATENDPMVIGRVMRAGADDVLYKPFDRRAMQEKFEDVGLVA